MWFFLSADHGTLRKKSLWIGKQQTKTFHLIFKSAFSKHKKTTIQLTALPKGRHCGDLGTFQIIPESESPSPHLLSYKRILQHTIPSCGFYKVTAENYWCQNPHLLFSRLKMFNYLREREKKNIHSSNFHSFLKTNITGDPTSNKHFRIKLDI